MVNLKATILYVPRSAMVVTLALIANAAGDNPSMSAALPNAAVTQPDAACADFAAMQAVVKKAILAANAASDAANQAALREAIASVAKTLVAQCSDAAGPIASIVIATAADSGVPDSTIGAGLGLAGAQIAQADPSLARAIAQTVANESDGGAAFAAAFIGAGGSVEIASLATAAPNVTGVVGVNTPVPRPVPPSGRPGPCAVPSCS